MKNLRILISLLIFPIAAMASDFTGLIVFLIEIPTLCFVIIFIILSLVMPKLGIIFMIIITVLQLPILIWATNGNYYGPIMITTFISSIIVLLITIYRHKNPNEKEYKSNIKVKEKQTVLNADEKAELEELLKKSFVILKQKGFSVTTLKYGWKVIEPSGAGRDFYDIEFLYSYALVQ